MKKNYIIRFFIGKGGVGKTTISSLYALKMSMKGLKTYIVSLDPAHNLGDVLDVKLGDEPIKISENLWAIEVDYDAMINKHLKELSDRIKDIYGYLKIFNLDKYVDVLKHSPGIEEQASLEKIIEIIRNYGEKGKADVIVFDTPPTGLMLRIMALPTISIIWIKKLLELRIAILERRKALTKITGEKLEVTLAGRKVSVPVEAKEDPIYNELIRLLDEYSWINNILTDQSKTYVALIINPELLSVLEAYRAYEFLNKLGITTKYIIANKVLRIKKIPEELEPKLRDQEKALSLAQNKFPSEKFVEIPYFPREPRGLEELRNKIKYVELIE
ncbi:Anion-transporting ATPase [Staphylothermus marinus F1]|uniref:Anion-transporting ATPase n=1 Tax=Staphylothermus marinus (strain ATCC 43588 / DSM 3639 / JCM 9404 / F1) TaxID=399550 RepID=A3DKV0_STAMF|nr:ArsA family ATPase [Staphylothermus marinus]ABN69260.1 Anion-transporting ATPase [Staphylothermus marinus F1]